MQEVPGADIPQSKAAKRLYKYTKNMASNLDKSIEKINEKEDVFKKTINGDGSGELRFVSYMY